LSTFIGENIFKIINNTNPGLFAKKWWHKICKQTIRMGRSQLGACLTRLSGVLYFGVNLAERNFIKKSSSFCLVKMMSEPRGCQFAVRTTFFARKNEDMKKWYQGISPNDFSPNNFSPKNNVSQKRLFLLQHF
jgi:hypothetical protein